jgi:hypothetical protein
MVMKFSDFALSMAIRDVRIYCGKEATPVVLFSSCGGFI